MHLDTQFLEFEFLDYDNVKPSKISFPLIQIWDPKLFF